MIDLHTHSSASDGTDTPAQLVGVAAAAGVTVLAITDHDTTAGWDEALAARPAGMTIVPGTEFSCRYIPAEGRRISLHLLGYLFDPEHEGLRAERARLRETRLHRAREMVENMTADGVPITWEQVETLAAGGPVGRPHLGRALVAAGVVPDVDTAFRDWLSSRRPYYVPESRHGRLHRDPARARRRRGAGVRAPVRPAARSGGERGGGCRHGGRRLDRSRGRPSRPRRHRPRPGRRARARPRAGRRPGRPTITARTSRRRSQCARPIPRPTRR